MSFLSLTLWYNKFKSIIGKATIAQVTGVSLLCFLFSLLVLTLIVKFADPFEGSLIWRIIGFIIIGKVVFWLVFAAGLVVRTFARLRDKIDEATLIESLRQALQTALFAELLIILQSHGLLSWWVVPEFIALLLVWEWLWINRIRNKEYRMMNRE